MLRNQIFYFLGFCCCLLTATAMPQPRLFLAHSHYDAGDVYRGQLISADYPFQNTGGSSLEFKGLHADCDCIDVQILTNDEGVLTPVSVDNAHFLPGRHGLIRLIFHTNAFAGDVSREVTVQTNVGASLHGSTLKLSAHIRQELWVQPALLDLNKLHRKEHQASKIRVFLSQNAKTGAETEIQSVFPSVSYVKIQPDGSCKAVPSSAGIPSLDSPRKECDYNVEFNDDSLSTPIPIGPLAAKIVVQNSSEFYPNYEIPVIGEIVGHLALSASYVEFGAASQQQSMTQTFNITSTEKNFQVSSVKIDLRRTSNFLDGVKESDLFSVTKTRLNTTELVAGENVGYSLSFRLSYPEALHGQVLPLKDLNSAQAVNVSGTFILRTTDTDDPEITLPFFGVLRLTAK